MRLEKLEALRGFAAFYVVLHHSLPHQYVVSGFNIGNLFRFGQEAVILFFLLSGFVINYTFQTTKDKTFRTYFFKRFSRIYLPLIIIMALGYAIECFRNGTLANPEIKVLLLNLLMLQDTNFLKPNVIVEPYMHNSPLWSLSYEWWFYMLYFPIQKFFRSTKSQSLIIFSIAIASSIIYGVYPEFIPRVLMYISIWWTGVYLSNKYLDNSAMSYYELKVPLISLLTICVILSAQALTSISSEHSVRIGIHPFLEARHHLFALIVVVLALIWNKHKWFWFDNIFSPFIFLAPMSYVIYISHYYLIADAHYLSFIDNEIIEWIGYILCLLIFSWLIEMILYPRLQRSFLNIAITSKRIK